VQTTTTHTTIRLAIVAALALIVLAAAGAFTAAASGAVTNDYVDIGGDHANEAVVRESPWLPTYNVGAKCYMVTASETLTIRPPAVWALSRFGSSSERVWWRAVTTYRARSSPYVEVAWQLPGTVLYRWMRVHRVVNQVGYETQGPAYNGTC
jgi:hypothetical protein